MRETGLAFDPQSRSLCIDSSYEHLMSKMEFGFSA